MTDNNKYLIVIPGSAGSYGATVGALLVEIDKIKKNNPNAVIHYSGVSSGSFVAIIALLCIINPQNHVKMHEELLQMINKDNMWNTHTINPYTHYQNMGNWYVGVKKFIVKYVKDISQINNRIHIGICKLDVFNGLTYHVVSTFKDVNDFISVIHASSQIPYYTHAKFSVKYKQFFCLDGWFLDNALCLPDYKNIKLIGGLSIHPIDRLVLPCNIKYLRLFEKGKIFHEFKPLVVTTVDKHPHYYNYRYTLCYRLLIVIAMFILYKYGKRKMNIIVHYVRTFVGNRKNNIKKIR
jgi:hypothetical protein